MAENNSSFFANRGCEYFPCHRTGREEDFNCLFCYCPLYYLGEDCGGCYVILENGVKDCSLCEFPHRPENYGKILAKLTEEYGSKKK